MARKDKSFKLYVLGLISMVMAIILIAYSLYVVPMTFFGWVYPLPPNFNKILIWLEANNAFKRSGVLFIPAIVAAIIFIYIARLCTFYIEAGKKRPDDDIPGPYAKWAYLKQPLTTKSFADLHPILTIVFLIILTIVLFLLFEFLLIYGRIIRSV